MKSARLIDAKGVAFHLAVELRSRLELGDKQVTRRVPVAQIKAFLFYMAIVFLLDVAILGFLALAFGVAIVVFLEGIVTIGGLSFLVPQLKRKGRQFNEEYEKAKQDRSQDESDLFMTTEHFEQVVLLYCCLAVMIPGLITDIIGLAAIFSPTRRSYVNMIYSIIDKRNNSDT